MSLAPPRQAKVLRLSIRAPAELVDQISGCLFEAGAAGIIEEADGLTLYPSDREELARLRAALVRLEESRSTDEEASVLQIEIDEVENTWSDTWQAALAPERITPHITLRPTHCVPAPEGETTLWFEPMTSFGSGDHPTTRLAAAWLETHLRSHPPLRCFDVGTGTGVLAFVAALCGAAHILAVDNDEIAVESAQRNAELNDLAGRVTATLGSANSTEEVFDLVMANINTPILHQLSAELAARVGPAGILILTGLLLEDIPELEQDFTAHGLQLQAQEESGEWGLLVFARSTQVSTS